MAGWPAPLWPLVRQYGGWAVWRAGLGFFGWPPTWIGSSGELKKLSQHMALCLDVRK